VLIERARAIQPVFEATEHVTAPARIIAGASARNASAPPPPPPPQPPADGEMFFGQTGRGLHSFPFQRNLSFSVHCVTQLFS